MSHEGSTSKEKKPDVKPEVNKVTITVKEVNGEEHSFQLKATSTLGKVHAALVTKKGVEKKSFHLLYDGRRILDSDTPESLGMESEDQVDLVQEQIGGQ
ncbi:ubiquitin-like protein [Atractiella rhizophila]|nr:ubiquitin-like protein [Atractiella rhizophila]